MSDIASGKVEWENRKEVMRRIRRMPKLVQRSMLVSAKVSIQFLVRYVIVNKLSGQSLNRVTGNAQRSISASPGKAPAERLSDGARATFGSNVDYVRAHNDGFDGNVQVQAHERRLFRTKSLRTGKELKRKQLSGSTKVRAHVRRVKMRARHFFEETMSEGRGGVEARLRKGILLALRTGKVPTQAQIEGG